MELHNNITRENLIILMTLFYKKVLDNQELNHFFTHELGHDITNDDWIEHIELLSEFWLAQLLNEGPYHGNFVGMHVHIPQIKRKDFATWLELFTLAVDATYTPEIAEVFKKRGKQLAQKFITELKI